MLNRLRQLNLSSIVGVARLPLFWVVLSPSSVPFAPLYPHFFFRRFSMISPSVLTGYLHVVCSVMKKGMFVTFKNFEVFWSVVVLYTVYMMNNFFLFQVATNLAFYYKTMFQDVSSSITTYSKRVIGCINAYISAAASDGGP